MNKLTEKEVRYVAGLAHLSLSEAEIPKLVANLDEILAHMDRLSEIDTTGVEPMAQVLYGGDPESVLRSDTPRPTLGSEAALANAPLSGPGYFKVPLVIER
jgi:aspartyl-tRNA(Asn)/glutamyl-tRNA(Gln) amidotransferase subunit C